MALHVSFWLAVAVVGLLIWRAMEWRYGGIIARLKDQLEGHSLADPKHTVSERRAIRERLGEFLDRGVEIQGQMTDDTRPIPKEAAQAWLDEVAEYLEAHLDKSFVARMRDDSTVPIGITPLSGERRDWWGGMRSKIYHLQQFIRELA